MYNFVAKIQYHFDPPQCKLTLKSLALKMTTNQGLISNSVVNGIDSQNLAPFLLYQVSHLVKPFANLGVVS